MSRFLGAVIVCLLPSMASAQWSMVQSGGDVIFRNSVTGQVETYNPTIWNLHQSTGGFWYNRMPPMAPQSEDLRSRPTHHPTYGDSIQPSTTIYQPYPGYAGSATYPAQPRRYYSAAEMNHGRAEAYRMVRDAEKQRYYKAKEDWYLRRNP